MPYVMPHRDHNLKEVDKIKVLEATIETLDFQIKKLFMFHSSMQVRIWKQRRARLVKQLLKLKEKKK